MVILHIANISNDMFSGVSVVVPEHVLAQNMHETVGFVNINNSSIKRLEPFYSKDTSNKIQIFCPSAFDINDLPEPFNSPDIVIFQECYCFNYIGIASNLRANNIPYIICPHGELRKEALKNKWFKKKIANILFFNRFINSSSAIQCLSQMEKESVHFSNNKIICTNGVLLHQKYKDHFNDDKVEFVYIGRYDWKVKGLDLLFDAIANLKPFLCENNCHFSLYGPDGKLGWTKQIKRLVQERKIDDIVSINSEVSGEKKEQALLKSDIFIQTSRHEGMPMGILEALSYGLPCLVTQGTSLGERIVKAKAGWCADNTSNSIANKMKQAIEIRSSWQELGKNGIELISREHSWEVESKRAIDKYKKVIEDYGSRTRK